MNMTKVSMCQNRFQHPDKSVLVVVGQRHSTSRKIEVHSIVGMIVSDSICGESCMQLIDCMRFIYTYHVIIIGMY